MGGRTATQALEALLELPAPEPGQGRVVEQGEAELLLEEGLEPAG